MKKAIVTVAQFILFLIPLAVGSVMNPFNLHWAATVPLRELLVSSSPTALLLAFGVFLAHFGYASSPQASVRFPLEPSFVLRPRSVSIGYAMKFGFVTKDLN